MKNLLPQDGEVFYLQDFFTPEESEVYFQQLLDQVPWRHEPIKIFGKEVLQPRLTAWYGDKEYSYSGITMNPIMWNEPLLNIKKKIEAKCRVTFNSALLNYYRDGKDSVGWHRDNEKELGPNPIIGSVSLGATRTLQFKHYQNPQLKLSLPLEHGSFLLMQGRTQHLWQHCIPKTTKVLAPRINITFRIV